MTPILWGFEEREKLMEFYERVSGARLHAAYFRPGGVHQDLPAGLADDIADLGRAPAEDVRRRREPADRQPHLQAAQCRHRHGHRGGGARLGLLRPDAARLGRRLGPAQGAALRRLRPTSTSTFRSARTATATTAIWCASRRCASRRASCARPAEDARGPGHVPTTARSSPPKRAEMKRSMEALIHHFKLYTEGYHVPAGEIYAAVEAPKGEFGVYLVADGTQQALPLQDPRAGLRAPAGDGLHVQGPHAGRRRRHPRLDRHRVRGDRPVRATTLPQARQPTSFAFTRGEPRARAKRIVARYPEGGSRAR